MALDQAESSATQLQEMLATAERRALQLEVAREVALRLMAALDPDELMAQVVQLVQDFFGFYHVNVYLMDAQAAFLNMAEGTGEAGRIMKENRRRLAVGQGLVGKVGQTGKPVLVADVSKEPQWLPNPLLPETRSELVVPLRLGDEILGALDVQSDAVNGLTEDDVSLLEGLGAQIAVAVQNARLFESERRRRLEATALQEISRALSLSLDLDLDRIMVMLLEQLQKVVSFDSAAIFLRDGDLWRWVVSFPSANEGVGVPQDSAAIFSVESAPLMQDIVETKEPIILLDAQADERFHPPGGAEGVRGWAGVPLVGQDSVVGIMTVASQQPGAYDNEAVQTLMAFASQAVIAFRNITLFSELEDHRTKLEEQVAERTRELRGFRAFAETAPDVILLSDLQQNVSYANPAFYTIFGYDAVSNEAVGLSITELAEEGAWAKIEKEVIAALKAAGSHRGNMTLVRRDGSTFLADVITFPVRDSDDTPTARAYLIRDITVEQRFQQEQDRLREDLISAQQRLIEELSIPIIPVTDDVLVVPLIGSIGYARAQRIIEALLKGIEDCQAQIVILDITGVPQVDSEVANHLMQAALAARLLGTESMLVGITPQVAQAFVDLDIDLSGIVTRSDLQSGIEYALSRMGLHITKKPSKMEQLRKMLEAQAEPQPEPPPLTGELSA
jgi:PAS domain S-box-containing protein